MKLGNMTTFGHNKGKGIDRRANTRLNGKITKRELTLVECETETNKVIKTKESNTKVPNVHSPK